MAPAASDGDGGARESRLVLLVTGAAPRSQRARGNLERALEAVGHADAHVEELDLLVHPDVALSYRVFATPALLWAEGDEARAVLYGDLSDRGALMGFLEDTVGNAR